MLNPIKSSSYLKPFFVTAGLVAAVVSKSAFAHHAFAAEFDANQPLELKGVVTKAQWVNPHSWLYLDIKDAEGKVNNWGFEFGAPFALKEKGLTKTSLPVGSEVLIKGYRSKSGQNYGYAVTVTLADGRTFQTGGAQDAPAADGAK